MPFILPSAITTCCLLFAMSFFSVYLVLSRSGIFALSHTQTSSSFDSFDCCLLFAIYLPVIFDLHTTIVSCKTMFEMLLLEFLISCHYVFFRAPFPNCLFRLCVCIWFLVSFIDSIDDYWFDCVSFFYCMFGGDIAAVIICCSWRWSYWYWMIWNYHKTHAAMTDVSMIQLEAALFFTLCSHVFLLPSYTFISISYFISPCFIFLWFVCVCVSCRSIAFDIFKWKNSISHRYFMALMFWERLRVCESKRGNIQM